MIYATSDLHGYSLEKFKDFLNKVGFCSQDKLYILGDVIDRGPDGVKLLKWIMTQPDVELLLGNHEDMLLSCEFLFEVVNEDSLSRLTSDKLRKYDIWMSNSGLVTLDAFSGVRDKEIQYILDFLRKAPLYKTLSVNGRDFILVHAGLGGFRSEKELSEYIPKELLWQRPTLYTDYFLNGPTVLLGHTPTVFFGEQHTGRILRTATWIDLDVGVGLGQEPALLRLDDMKEFYYKDIK